MVHVLVSTALSGIVQVGGFLGGRGGSCECFAPTHPQLIESSCHPLPTQLPLSLFMAAHVPTAGCSWRPAAAHHWCGRTDRHNLRLHVQLCPLLWPWCGPVPAMGCLGVHLHCAAMLPAGCCGRLRGHLVLHALFRRTVWRTHCHPVFTGWHKGAAS